MKEKLIRLPLQGRAGRLIGYRLRELVARQACLAIRVLDAHSLPSTQ